MQQLAASATLDVLADALRALQSVRTHDSLISYTQPARVEPIVLLDQSCVHAEMTPDVMQSLLSQFAGYWLQAWSMSATVGNVDVHRHLEKLNPGRDPINSALGIAGRALEEFSMSLEGLDFLGDRLPVPGNARSTQIALEADLGQARDKARGYRDQVAGREAQSIQTDQRRAFTGGQGSDDVKEIREVSNLSVGKMLKVEILGDNGNKISIPVNIRLLVNAIDEAAIAHILSIGSKDNSFKERWHAWRSGQITLVKDLLLCGDLIDEHRRTLMKDTSGLYQQILARARGNQAAGILTGSLSVATASNIAVISSDTAAALENRIGARLRDPKTRAKLFEKTYLMILAVIDKETDRVTFYYRGIPEHTSLNHREIKASNKGMGPDVSDILNAYKAGNSPSL